MATQFRKIAAPILQNTTASSAVDLADLDKWNKLSVELTDQSGGGLDTSSASISITGAGVSSDTFLPIVTDGTDGLNNVTTGAIVTLGNGGTAWPRYIKVNADTTATAAAGYLAYVHVMSDA